MGIICLNLIHTDTLLANGTPHILRGRRRRASTLTLCCDRLFTKMYQCETKQSSWVTMVSQFLFVMELWVNALVEDDELLYCGISERPLFRTVF